MKRILIILSLITVFSSCTKDYTLDEAFSVPTVLNSPSEIDINIESTDNIVLSWEGGGAEDGSYVIYNVLFDLEGGDFSAPVETMPSDLGAQSQLTITHAQLNIIARKAGIALEKSGNIIWTVQTSKGGVVKETNQRKSIVVTRGEGIDNIPEKLYLDGEGNESQGAERSLFRMVEEGVFVIYSLVTGDGQLVLKGDRGGSEFEYSYGNNKLTEGEGGLQLSANSNPYRITVDFNTLIVKAELISSLKCIWGVNFVTIGELSYIGSGTFEAPSCPIQFVDPSVPGTGAPAWLSWIENRYYFIATVDAVDLCWGRLDGISAEEPGSNEPIEFFELGEFAWSQWDHLWKMSSSLNNKTVKISIKTNEQNLMIHELVAIP